MLPLIAAITLFWQVPPTGDINRDKVVYLIEQRCGPDGQNGNCTRTIVGGWRIEDSTYHRYLGGKFELSESECPTSPPPKEMLPSAPVKPKRPNFGLGPPGESVRPKEFLADDSQMPRLTIIGPFDKKNLPADIAACVLFWNVLEDHWSVKGWTGGPAFLTTADGKALYIGAIDFSAIRLALEPPKPPDSTPEPPLAVPGTDVPYGWIVAGILVFLVWRAKR